MTSSTADAATPAPSADTSSDLVKMYEVASRIRECDERFRQLLSSGQVAMSYYSPAGQELIPAAFSTVLDRRDLVLTTYRGLHDQVGKGVPLRPLWAEFLGRSTGSCGGKGGPMHMTDVDAGLVVTTGIVGAGLPIATGLALASQLRNENRVVVVNFGDGASNEGAFHEALNLASLWTLPVVFVCQNNFYAEYTSYAAGTSVGSIADRSAAYTMNGCSVDGNDPDAIVAAARESVSRARAGDGPTLLEARTYRFHGHSFGDAMKYMPADEREAAMRVDPVRALRNRLLSSGLLSEAALNDLEDRVRAEVDDAVQFALSSPPPNPEELLTDVFSTDRGN